MKRLICAAAAIAMSLLSIPAATAAEIGDPVLTEVVYSRIDVRIDSASVYVNRMPCADRCARKSVIALTAAPGCHANVRVTVLSLTEGVAVVKLSASKRIGPSLCVAGKRDRASVTVTGAVSVVVDATTGQPVSTKTFETF